MALAVATPTSSGITGTSVSVTSTGATGGTGPYTYQWYRSTVSGFSPGSSNLVSGATGLTLNDSGLFLGVKYFYVLVATDTGNANATANSSQLAVQLLTTPPISQGMNQFAIAPYLGTLDEHLNWNTLPVQFDPAGSNTLAPGQAVKFSTAGLSGIPQVLPSTASSDVVCGFVNYNFKNTIYNPGDKLQISYAGNVIHLLGLAAINRGTPLYQIPTGTGGGVGVVAAVTGSSGYPIIGWAYDQIAAAGILRVMLTINLAAYNVD